MIDLLHDGYFVKNKFAEPSVTNAYADAETCTLAIEQQESVMFSGLVYSYATCGSINTYRSMPSAEEFTFQGDLSTACGVKGLAQNGTGIEDDTTAVGTRRNSTVWYFFEGTGCSSIAPCPHSSIWIWILVVAPLNLVMTIILVFYFCCCVLPAELAKEQEDADYETETEHENMHLNISLANPHGQDHSDVMKLEREFKEVADEEHIIEKKVADMNSKMDKFFDEMRASVRLQSGAENAQRASLTPVSGAQILRRVDKDFEKVQGEVAAMAKEEHMLSEQMATMQSQLDSFFHDIRAGVGDRPSSMGSQQSFFQQQSSARSQQSGAQPSRQGSIRLEHQNQDSHSHSRPPRLRLVEDAEACVSSPSVRLQQSGVTHMQNLPSHRSMRSNGDNLPSHRSRSNGDNLPSHRSMRSNGDNLPSHRSMRSNVAPASSRSQQSDPMPMHSLASHRSISSNSGQQGVIKTQVAETYRRDENLEHDRYLNCLAASHPLARADVKSVLVSLRFVWMHMSLICEYVFECITAHR
jgi:cell division protein FtsB